MAFTKITASGIGSTETVTLDGLTVINNVSIGGTLTYEDVTNIDSVGLITARAGVNVGSGITLSKDGDIFATGIVTATSFVGSGSGLTGVASTDNIRTNTDATFLQNVIVGSGITLSKDGDVFFTGIATGNGSGLTNLATDLVNDTSPQLGGDLDTNDFEILLDDNHAVKFGAGVDLDLRSNGTNGIVHSPTGHLRLQTTGSDKNVILENASTGEYYGIFKANGAAELYHDGTKQCETSADGLAFPSGKGINFNATADASATGTTAGSELLDDYEEGSWTPQIRKFANGNFATAAGMADNGTVQRSKYTKIGDTVTVFLHWNGFQVSDANYAALGGLPFSTTNNGGGGGTIGYTNAFTNNQNQGILVGSNGDTIYFYINSNAWNGWSTSSNRDIYLTATYFTS